MAMPRLAALARSARALLAAALLAAAPAAARAQEAVPADIVQAEILPGWSTPAGTRMAALHIRLAPGWKTYWRAPGDAGIPPAFRLVRGSRNHRRRRARTGRAPLVFDQSDGIRSRSATQRELVLPIELRTPKRPGAPMPGRRGEIDLGVCEDRLRPRCGSTFSADMLPAATARWTRRRSARPWRVRPVSSAAEAGVTQVACAFSAVSDGVRLDARLEMPRIGGDEVVLVEAGDPGIWVSEAQVARRGGALHVRVDMAPPPGRPLALDRSALRFTVLGRSRAVDIRGCD